MQSHSIYYLPTFIVSSIVLSSSPAPIPFEEIAQKAAVDWAKLRAQGQNITGETFRRAKEPFDKDPYKGRHLEKEFERTWDEISPNPEVIPL